MTARSARQSRPHQPDSPAKQAMYRHLTGEHCMWIDPDDYGRATEDDLARRDPCNETTA